MTEERTMKGSGLTGRLIFTIIAAALGSAFQHGYNTGVVNAPQELIEKWIKETKSNRSLEDGEDGLVLDTTVTFIWSIAVSIFCVGGMVGGCIVGVVADNIGRKKGLLLNNVFVAIAAATQGFAKAAGSFELFIVGRFFIGLNSGLNAGLVPVYLSEVSPVNLRGAIGSVYQFIITISIMSSQLLGLEQVFGTETLWPNLFSLIVIPALFQICTLPFCPESPKHLLTKGKDTEANQVLIWLRGDHDVKDEMDKMKSEQEAEKSMKKVNLRELFRNSSLRIPLIIASVLMLAQQFSGINAAMYFSTSIFTQADLSEKSAQYATLGMGATNVLMTGVSIFLVEKAGRKTLLLIGFLGMFFSTLFLIVCLNNSDVEAIAYMSIVAVLLFVVFFSIGPGSIPWFMVTELFSQNARPAATSVAVVVNWAANFIVGLGFLPLKHALGNWVFLIFAVLQALSTLFIYKKVPETKNKTSEEISAMFRQASYE